MSEGKLPKEEEKKLRERLLVELIERQIKSVRRIADVIAEAAQRADTAIDTSDRVHAKESICEVEKQVEKLSKELLYTHLLCGDLMKVGGCEEE